MGQSGLMKAALFFFAITLIGALYWLTASDISDSDPCANPQSDISAAVLSEEGDQDALINRAIIMKGNCEESAD